MNTSHFDVLIVNQIEGSQTGGFTGYETDKPTYLETIAPTYLRSHFYYTFCSEAANCMQLAAAIRAPGFTVKVLDGLLLNLTADGLREKMNKYTASVYVFTLFHSSYTAVISLIRDLKQREPNSTIVTGGNYATLVYREILEKNPEIDYVLIGEADLSMPALCRHIISNTTVDEVPGLAYRGDKSGFGESSICLTQPQIPNIDDVLPLARDYSKQVLEHNFSFSMVSSRGCGLGTCSFCYLPEYQRVSHIPKWRGKSPEKVIAEMEYLRDTYGVSHITFVDEDFIGPRVEGTARLLKFATLLIQRKTNMTWYANALVISVLHLVREGHIELLAKSGLRYFFVGIESGSDHILKRFKKGFTVEKLREMIAVLDRYGIRINPGLITFLPESTPEEVKANVDIIRLIRYYDVFVFTRRLVRLPGTEEGCGCAATDPAKNVSTTWLLPDEEYSQHMATDVEIVPEKYFDHLSTRCLYAGLAQYRDEVFPTYYHLMKQSTQFTDPERNRLIQLHLDFFDTLYQAVKLGQVTTTPAAKSMAIKYLRKTLGIGLQEEIHAIQG